MGFVKNIDRKQGFVVITYTRKAMNRVFQWELPLPFTENDVPSLYEMAAAHKDSTQEELSYLKKIIGTGDKIAFVLSQIIDLSNKDLKKVGAPAKKGNFWIAFNNQKIENDSALYVDFLQTLSNKEHEKLIIDALKNNPKFIEFSKKNIES